VIHWAGSAANNDRATATLYATVSASYMVEQMGLPHLEAVLPNVANEVWNGERPSVRLARLRERVRKNNILN
jgi:hypothetical protein